MQIKERLEKETAREYAYRILRENIIILELEPGSLVSENELAALMGLSRTPVREALIELSKSHIVEIYPQKGSYISKIDYELVEEARFLRTVLESAIVELACDMLTESNITSLRENLKLQEFYLENPVPDKLLELDNQFHEQLFTACNKTQTYHLMNSMMAHYDRIRSMSLKAIKDIKIVEDHNSILQAILDKNKKEASAIMDKHLSRYIVDKEGICEKYPQYFV